MKQFEPGDKVVYVTRKINAEFLDHIKNIPTVALQVIYDRSYKSGCALKIPLWHDPIDSHYFNKIQ